MRYKPILYPKIQSKVNNHKAPSKAEGIQCPSWDVLHPSQEGNKGFFVEPLVQLGTTEADQSAHTQPAVEHNNRIHPGGNRAQVFPHEFWFQLCTFRICAEGWKSCCPSDQAPLVNHSKYPTANALQHAA